MYKILWGTSGEGPRKSKEKEMNVLSSNILFVLSRNKLKIKKEGKEFLNKKEGKRNNWTKKYKNKYSHPHFACSSQEYLWYTQEQCPGSVDNSKNQGKCISRISSVGGSWKHLQYGIGCHIDPTKSTEEDKHIHLRQSHACHPKTSVWMWWWRRTDGCHNKSQHSRESHDCFSYYKEPTYCYCPRRHGSSSSGKYNQLDMSLDAVPLASFVLVPSIVLQLNISDQFVTTMDQRQSHESEQDTCTWRAWSNRSRRPGC